MKQRLKYIDTLRGFTMLLVVFHHVSVYSFGIEVGTPWLAGYLLSFRMPMFFFVSGFVGYKALSFWNIQSYTHRLLTKAHVQLIPTIVFWVMYSVILQVQNWPFPSGFWFTVVLFEYFIIYFTVGLIFRNWASKFEDIILLIIATSLAVCSKYCDFGTDIYNQTLVLDHMSTYFIYFVFGLLSSKYRNIFFKMMDNYHIVLIAVLGCLTLPIIKLKFGYQILPPFCKPLVFLSMSICMLFIGFKIFYSTQTYWNKNGKIQNTLEYIGRRTLDLYMLHNFFLPIIPINSAVKDFLCLNLNTVIYLATIGVITVLVTTFSLLTSYIIRLSPFLAKWLFGVTPKTPYDKAHHQATYIQQ